MTTTHATPRPSAVERPASPYDGFWAVTRIFVGFIFFWTFLDKTFGLGRATESEKAWVNGNSPTTGFLKGVTAPDSENPVSGLFEPMVGAVWADWLFMLGMLGVGTAVILGIALRPAAAAAVPLLGLLYVAVQPLENNPLVDEHLIYLAAIISFAATFAGDSWSLGRWWRGLPVVRDRPFLY